MRSTEAADKRLIGDLAVHPVALGSAADWVFSATPGDPKALDGIATIHAAIDEGVDLLDTARAYTSELHPGYGEALIQRALRGHPQREDVFVATKGGMYRDGARFSICGEATALQADWDISRAMLGVDRIDLYFLHWPDPYIPIGASAAALAQMRDRGWIRNIGLSNVSVAQLEEAQAAAPIAAVQNHFSPFDQQDREMVDLCAERGIAYLSYSPLTGSPFSDEHPQFDQAFPRATALAARKGVSIRQLAIAWLLSVSPTMIPICGASRPQSICDSARGATLELDQVDLAELDF